MKIITILGARPQFIKAATVSRAISDYNVNHSVQVCEKILHTGQHFDDNMSQVFFDTLQIPQPIWHLTGCNGSHAQMTAQMLTGIEQILMDEKPDYVLVYGDTNSTLSGALAASKLHIPVVHVEAGLRSFNKQMPEEINRILTDHMSDWLFCPTTTAVANLRNEGITDGVYHVGDVMFDAAITFGKVAEIHSEILSKLHLQSKQFYLCTLHRAENTDHETRLQEITEALIQIATNQCPLIWPLHPRTRKCIEKYQLLNRVASHPAIQLIDPVDYLDMVMLEKHAQLIFTDSGGIQKEAYFHRTPCITLRDETEWVETVTAGWNQLAGYRTAQILRCFEQKPAKSDIQEYGNGQAAVEIIETLVSQSTAFTQ